MPNPCACGCGEIAKSRFVHGHNARGPDAQRITLETQRSKPPIPCACGCGALIPPVTKCRRPARFVHGHNARAESAANRATRTAAVRAVAASRKGKRSAQRGSAHGGWKGGRWVSNRGYVHVYAPDHRLADRHGYVREHRLVWEAVNGPLELGMHVHHLNGDKTDNRPENLIAVTVREHTEIHRAMLIASVTPEARHVAATKAWETKRRKAAD